MVEGARLESVYVGRLASGVRIPFSPPGEKHDEFGESGFCWVIEDSDTHLQFLLACTYWRPGIEKEMSFYKANGFNVKKPILKKINTLEVAEDKYNPIRKYLFRDLYAIFRL